MRPIRYSIGLGLLLLAPLSIAATQSEEEAWLEDDAEFRAAEVNEGALVFLATPVDETVHHHINRIIIHPESLEDGWVTLVQCHENLDPVARAQVTYNKPRTRELTIDSFTGIEKVWVEDASVQLKNVGKQARLCVHARAQALHANADGSFSLYNGPFMRRFLDGYYPMRVSVAIELPADRLRFATIDPPAQRGFAVTHTARGVSFDAWFEGRLRTEIRLERTVPLSLGPGGAATTVH